jgi:hypothetical protein
MPSPDFEARPQPGTEAGSSDAGALASRLEALVKALGLSVALNGSAVSDLSQLVSGPSPRCLVFGVQAHEQSTWLELLKTGQTRHRLECQPLPRRHGLSEMFLRIGLAFFGSLDAGLLQGPMVLQLGAVAEGAGGLQMALEYVASTRSADYRRTAEGFMKAWNAVVLGD